MALRLLKEGRKNIINQLRDRFNASVGVQAWTNAIHLFKTNITPTENDTDGTYLPNEANFTGYASIATTGWSASTTQGNSEQTVAASCLFQVAPPASVGNQIYGYYMQDQVQGHVMWAEAFAGAPLSMTVAGDAIVVIPQFSDISQFP